MTLAKVGFLLLSAVFVLFMTLQPVQAMPEPIAEERAAATIAMIVGGLVAEQVAGLLTNLTTKKKETDLMSCYWNDWKKRDKQAKKQKTYNSCR